MRRVARRATVYSSMPERLQPPVVVEDWLTPGELASADGSSLAGRDWLALDAWSRWVDAVLAHLAAERGVSVIYGSLVDVLGDEIPRAQWRT